MKKSLVALAVLAASGAAMAQVSITGNLTAGFQSSTDVNSNITSGLGVDTAEIVFSATEDLGGGLKASAKLGLVDSARGMTRTAPNVNTGFGPGDAELGLSGSFGQVKLSTARSTDYLSSGVAGVGGTFMDGRIFDERVSKDSISYSVPVGPVTLGFTYAEAPNLLGLGTGTSGNTTLANNQVLGTRQLGLNVQYANGPVAADFGYFSNEQLANNADNGHYRASASYDFGVAKVGGGVERQSFSNNATGIKTTKTDALLAVSVPVGAVTLGANWGQRVFTENPATDGTLNGYGLKASYALSKRTSVSADYTNWNGAVNANKQSQYNLFLSHSF